MDREVHPYKKVKVWSWTLRISHWSFALSILILILSGLYIHEPLPTWIEYRPSYFMLTMRYLHFTAAFFFMASVILRIYLLFFGNKYEKPTSFLPINRANWETLRQELKFKFYLTDHLEHRLGHTILAGITYFLILLASLLMIFSGLYMLYPESGVIKALAKFFFGTQQLARTWHYIFLYFFVLFVLIHLYILIWTELRLKEPLVSSMFSGYKIAEKKRRTK